VTLESLSAPSGYRAVAADPNGYQWISQVVWRHEHRFLREDPPQNLCTPTTRSSSVRLPPKLPRFNGTDAHLSL